MTNVLVRDIPDEVLRGLDAHATRLGISRTEYIRRRLAQDAAVSYEPVTVEDFRRFADTVTDLSNAEVMKRAWE